MKHDTLDRLWKAAAGAVFAVIGCMLFAFYRADALAANQDKINNTSMFLFSIGLICMLVGAVILLSCLPAARRKTSPRTLAYAAMFAALCYIGFTFFKVDIPVGTEKTAFHLGNVFCVLAALFLGGTWGGMAGAVGMTIADLTTAYVSSAPKTFFLKLCIGLITGLVAHKVFQISREKARKVPLAAATVLSCAAGMAFNVVADPLVGYFYKQYIWGTPQDAAMLWAKIGAVTTAVNAVVAVVVASVLYLALRPVLKKANLMPEP